MFSWDMLSWGIFSCCFALTTSESSRLDVLDTLMYVGISSSSSIAASVRFINFTSLLDESFGRSSIAFVSASLSSGGCSLLSDIVGSYGKESQIFLANDDTWGPSTITAISVPDLFAVESLAGEVYVARAMEDTLSSAAITRNTERYHISFVTF